MNELVFKGQDDQVLTNSLYTDTTESYKDEDGVLLFDKSDSQYPSKPQFGIELLWQVFQLGERQCF